MTPEQFVYWLQGFAEVAELENGNITPKQWQQITDHLKTVFHKVTPDRDIHWTPETYRDTNKKNPLDPPYQIIC